MIAADGRLGGGTGKFHVIDTLPMESRRRLLAADRASQRIHMFCDDRS